MIPVMVDNIAAIVWKLFYMWSGRQRLMMSDGRSIVIVHYIYTYIYMKTAGSGSTS